MAGRLECRWAGGLTGMLFSRRVGRYAGRQVGSKVGMLGAGWLLGRWPGRLVARYVVDQAG